MNKIIRICFYFLIWDFFQAYEYGFGSLIGIPGKIIQAATNKKKHNTIQPKIPFKLTEKDIKFIFSKQPLKRNEKLLLKFLPKTNSNKKLQQQEKFRESSSKTTNIKFTHQNQERNLRLKELPENEILVLYEKQNKSKKTIKKQKVIQFIIMQEQGFKNLVNIDKNSKVYGLKQIANDTLRIGDMSMAVELPKGENLNEWLAVNTIEFFNEISLLFGCLTEFCNKKTCPTMSAGPRFEYLWADGNKMTKPLKVSAAEYIDFLMSWVENQIHNDQLFPSQIGVKFPMHFKKIVKVIFKRLFRVYAHIYHSHFNDIIFLEAEPHLNTSFKHFIYFIDEFELVDSNELAPLSELIMEFKERRKKKNNQLECFKNCKQKMKICPFLDQWKNDEDLRESFFDQGMKFHEEISDLEEDISFSVFQQTIQEQLIRRKQ